MRFNLIRSWRHGRHDWRWSIRFHRYLSRNADRSPRASPVGSEISYTGGVNTRHTHKTLGNSSVSVSGNFINPRRERTTQWNNGEKIAQPADSARSHDDRTARRRRSILIKQSRFMVGLIFIYYNALFLRWAARAPLSSQTIVTSSQQQGIQVCIQFGGEFRHRVATIRPWP